eukprot:gene9030-8395_t
MAFKLDLSSVRQDKSLSSTLAKCAKALAEWLDTEISKADDCNSKPRCHIFSKKAAPEALLSLLEEQDEELTTEIVSALTVCIQSSLKAERLDEKVEDFASQEDMLGLLRPNIVKLLMKHGGDAGFALLKDVASEDSHKGLQAPQLLREEVGRLI